MSPLFYDKDATAYANRDVESVWVLYAPVTK